MRKRILNHNTIVMHKIDGWREYANDRLTKSSDQLHERYMKKFSGQINGDKSKYFFETLRGTVSSGDAHPTTHGNTIG